MQFWVTGTAAENGGSFRCCDGRSGKESLFSTLARMPSPAPPAELLTLPFTSRLQPATKFWLLPDVPALLIIHSTTTPLPLPGSYILPRLAPVQGEPVSIADSTTLFSTRTTSTPSQPLSCSHSFGFPYLFRSQTATAD